MIDVGVYDDIDIVGDDTIILYKKYARVSGRRPMHQDGMGERLASFLSGIVPGRQLLPVKIVKVEAYHPRDIDSYIVVFDNGASIIHYYLEAIMNHPTMTIHEAMGAKENMVALMVKGKLAGVVAGAKYESPRSITLWEAS